MLIDTYIYAVVIYNVWNNIKLTILLWKLCIKIRGPSTGTGTSNMRPVAISYNIYSGIPTKSWMFPVHLELHPAKSNLNYLPFESLLHEPHQEPHVLHIQPLANYHQSCIWRQSIALKGLDSSGESLTSTSKPFLCSWASSSINSFCTWGLVYEAFFLLVWRCPFRTGSNSALQCRKKSKFPSSLCVVLSQLWPRNGSLHLSRTITTSIIGSKIAVFRFILLLIGRTECP